MKQPPKTVKLALTMMGVDAALAARAAADTRIHWDEDALLACKALVDRSKYASPGAELWTGYLSLGDLPVMPTMPEPASDIPAVCPICQGPLSKCRGAHGYARMLNCVGCGQNVMVCGGCCPVVEVVSVAKPARRKARAKVQKQEEIAV